MGKVLFVGFVMVGFLASAWAILTAMVKASKGLRRGKLQRQLDALSKCLDSPDGLHHGPEVDREEKPRVDGAKKQFSIFRKCRYCHRPFQTSKGGGWKPGRGPAVPRPQLKVVH